MHALIDLKNLFEKNGIEVTFFDGIRLLVKGHGKWGMAFGEYYQNGKEVSRKEINELIARIKK
ncbi:MAG: hypothetical protein CMP47_12415 [Rickettsiales bacterium]|nr:hypothetical protein [Rickettsiales bacterium]|tara:strand:+ start:305 stop:493 length:189 start_codon:yes stop_codon:yes gene_type:complete